MTPWASALLAVAVISAVPLAATMLLALNAQAVRRGLPLLVAFGAGALSGAALLHLLPHAAERTGVPATAAGALIGFLLFAGVERLPGAHDHAHAHGLAMGGPSGPPTMLAAAPPRSTTGIGVLGATRAEARAHAHTHSHEHSADRHLVPLNFLADAAHNLVDGMLVAAAFLMDSGIGVATMFAVALHELPREVGTFAVFVHGGVSAKRAVFFNAVTGGIAMGGAALTLLVGPRIDAVALWILPAAAGSYLYIAQAVGRPALQREGDVAWGLRAAAAALGFAAMSLGAGLL